MQSTLTKVSHNDDEGPASGAQLAFDLTSRRVHPVILPEKGGQYDETSVLCLPMGCPLPGPLASALTVKASDDHRHRPLYNKYTVVFIIQRDHGP